MPSKHLSALLALLGLILMNSCGGGSSEDQGPRIQTQPSSQTVQRGKDVRFSVVALGQPSPSYQWRKEALPLSGSTASTLELTAVQPQQAGSYDVVVSNSLGSVTSQGAALTIQYLDLLLQPQSLSVQESQMAAFSIEATGVPAPSFQWLKNGVPVSGAKAPNWSFQTTLADDGASVTCEVSNGIFTIQSQAANLKVSAKTQAPVILSQPSPLDVLVGQDARFEVKVSGTAPLAFQWKKDGASIIASPNAAEYRLASAQLADSGFYSVRVSNEAGQLDSQAARLTVREAPEPPAILEQPTDASVLDGETVQFKVRVSGTEPFTFAWKKNGQALPSTQGRRRAEAANTLTLTAHREDHDALFRCDITNIAGMISTREAKLSVLETPLAPSFILHPSSQTSNEGQPLTLRVSATGSPTPTYQWQRRQAEVWVDLPSATTSSLNFPALQLQDSGDYRCKATNPSGSATSQTATLTVLPPPAAPVITSHPKSQTVVEGQPATFEVSAAGSTPMECVWFFNGQPQPGTQVTPQSWTYTRQVGLADQGAKIRAQVSNALGTVSSNEAILTVQAAPSFQLQLNPANLTLQAGREGQSRLSILPLNAFSGSVSFSAQAPQGITVLFDPAQSSQGCDLRIQTAPSLPQGSYTITLQGMSSQIQASVTLQLEVLTPDPAPIISEFKAQPLVLLPGQCSQLSWIVSPGASLILEPGLGDVTDRSSLQVCPNGSITYRLTATNPGGSVSATASVEVFPGSAPIISEFQAEPAFTQAGQSTVLSWKAEGARELRLEPGVGSVLGLSQVTLNPAATTNYALTASNPAGSLSKQITVTVATPGGPVIQEFTALSPSINAGQVATLNWKVSGAESLRIEPGFESVTTNSQLFVLPKESKTYTLVAKGSSGTSFKSKTVNVQGTWPYRLDHQQMLEDVRRLASPDMGGRRMGSTGNKLAQSYLKQRLQKLGLNFFGNGYEQTFTTAGGGTNLVGWVPASSPSSKYFLVCGHYDHIGTRSGVIVPGADDNASGTAAVLQLAEQIKAAPLKRNIIFALFDGEELGLYGSEAFVNTPPVPLNSIELVLNLDMVSRADFGSMGILGTRWHPSLCPLVETAAKTWSLPILFGYDGQPEDYTSMSDQYPFHRRGIPFLFFCCIDHNDYHTPRDTYEKISPEFFMKGAETALDTLKALDQLQAIPTLFEPGSFPPNPVPWIEFPRNPRAWTPAWEKQMP